jgi:hypothetical protein
MVEYFFVLRSRIIKKILLQEAQRIGYADEGMKNTGNPLADYCGIVLFRVALMRLQ